MGWENETLRFPTNLDGAAIVARLVKIREEALAAGPSELGSLLADVREGMPSGQIGARVISAMAWLQEKPEHESIAAKLEMLALNLKNLK